MKISAKNMHTLSPTAYRILLVGLISCLLLSGMAFVLMLQPITYQRLEAVSAIMSFTCRGLVLTVLASVITDILKKRANHS